MFHVLTVHWHDDRFIEPQRRFLDRNLDDYRVYAALNGVDEKWFSHFDYAEDMKPQRLWEKLDALAVIAREHAKPDDYFLFIDGDAFPIAPLTPEVLGGTELAAVRRDENLGEPYPHPCFCVARVGFWFDIQGTWNFGVTFTASNGDTLTDEGMNLLDILRRESIPWRPLLRSNTWNLDPVLFGVYDNVGYHHGAGFRRPVTQRVLRPHLEAAQSGSREAIVPESVPLLGRLERSLRSRVRQRQEARRFESEVDHTQELSAQVYEWIKTDDDFYRRFTEGTGPA